jgi:hypothetical protein
MKKALAVAGALIALAMIPIAAGAADAAVLTTVTIPWGRLAWPGAHGRRDDRRLADRLDRTSFRAAILAGVHHQ